MQVRQWLQSFAHEQVAGSGDIDIADLTDDSRCVEPGMAFVVRGGASGDGERFIDDAIGKGASALVVGPNVDAGVLAGTYESRAIAQLDQPIDQAMAGQLASRLFDQPWRDVQPIAVTGTNGKTTVAHIVQHLLASIGIQTGLIGTVSVDYGNGRATPAKLTTPGAIDLIRHLAKMRDAGCKAVAIETSSHALAQGRCDCLYPRVGIFTNLSGDHLDYHKTLDDYAAAKARLFALLSADGLAVINGDDPQAQGMADAARAAGCPVVTTHVAEAGGSRLDRPGSERAAVVIESAKAASMQLTWHVANQTYDGALALTGRHNASNALQAVVAAAHVAGSGDGTEIISQMIASLATFPGVPGRLERVPSARFPLTAENDVNDVALPTVLVDYAHTDDALANVLRALRPVTTGRLITVFGCGGDRDATKRPRMAAAACEYSDVVIITSDNPRSEDPSDIIDQIRQGVPADFADVHVQVDRAVAIRDAVMLAGRDDTVLIAGKGHEDYQITRGSDGSLVRGHFDDREQALKAIGQWRKQQT